MKKRKLMRLLLAAGVTFAALGTEAEAAIESPAEKALASATGERQAAAARQAQQIAHSAVTVTSVEMAADAALSRTEVLRLVPEIQKETVNVQRLSRQLALYNEGYLVNAGSSGGEAHIQVAGGAVTQQHSAGKRQTGSIYAYDESDITLKGTESITFDGASQGFSDGSHVRADGKITFAAPIIKIKLPTEIAGGEIAGLDADKTSIAAGSGRRLRRQDALRPARERPQGRPRCRSRARDKDHHPSAGRWRQRALSEVLRHADGGQRRQ